MTYDPYADERRPVFPGWELRYAAVARNMYSVWRTPAAAQRAARGLSELDPEMEWKVEPVLVKERRHGED